MLSGLDENENLITHPNDKLRDGAKIQPIRCEDTN